MISVVIMYHITYVHEFEHYEPVVQALLVLLQLVVVHIVIGNQHVPHPSKHQNKTNDTMGTRS